MVDLKMPEDFESKLNRNVLLTGAGFSKDFGALLADEISIRLFNLEKITKSIKSKIVHCSRESNYEDIFDLISDDERGVFQESLFEIFKEMDLKVTKEVKGIGKIVDLFYKADRYNFIFTLNQDLLMERYFLYRGKENQNNYKSNNEEIIKNLDSILSVTFPYVDYSLSSVVRCVNGSNGCIQSPSSYGFDDFSQNVKFEENFYPKIGCCNYVKIHGSSSWTHGQYDRLLITGKNKIGKLQKSNIFIYGLSLFEKVLDISNLRIVIIGYSFSDEHINKVLLKAIKKGAKLFIINSEKFDQFKGRIEKVDSINEKKNCFLDAIEKYFPLTFKRYLEKENGYSALLTKILS